jgi:TldD protein
MRSRSPAGRSSRYRRLRVRLSEGYLIENGRITAPVRGATLIGNGLDVLKRIDAIGDDLRMKSGFCGKDGQQVPVGTGQPTVRISEMTVGGTDV